MSKKNKWDINVYEQKEMIDALNNALYGNEKLPTVFEEDSENESFRNNSKIGNFAMNMINKNKHEVCQQQNKVPELSKYNDKKIRLNEIRIKRIPSEFRLVSISDGVRNLIIDLNTLEKIEFEGLYGDSDDDNETLKDDIVRAAYARLDEILTNFYPSAIITVDKVKERFEKINEYSDDRFAFFELPNSHSKIVLGYYISQESLDIFESIIKELIDFGTVVSFIKALDDMTSIPGFSFKNLSEIYIKQLMLTERYKDSTNNFINLFVSDKETICDENTHNKSIFQAVTVLPLDYSTGWADQLIDLIEGRDSDDDFDDEDFDDDDDEDSDDEDLNDENEPLEKDIDDNDSTIEEEVLSNCKESSPEINQTFNNSDATVVIADNVIIEDSNGDELLDDDYDDPEEMEKMYFNTTQAPRSSMKPLHRKSDDDDSFVIKRRN